MFRTSLWLIRPGVGYNFEVFLCKSLFVFKICFVFLTVFSLFCSGCVLFSKIESFGLVLSSTFLCFIRLWLDLRVVLQKNNSSNFNLVLVWFGYRGLFFLSHAISLWFCDVIKLLLLL